MINNIKPLESLEEIEKLIEEIITTYNGLKQYPKIKNIINNYKECNSILTIMEQKRINSIELQENILDKQSIILDIEFDNLIKELEINHFMAIGCQKEITIDDESDEMTIRINLIKIAEKYITLDFKERAKLKKQFMRVNLLQKTMLSMQSTLLNQIQELYYLFREDKSNSKIKK